MTIVRMPCTHKHYDAEAHAELKTLRERVENQRRELARLNEDMVRYRRLFFAGTDRIDALEAALERIHKGEQPAHKLADDALWKSRGTDSVGTLSCGHGAEHASTETTCDECQAVVAPQRTSEPLVRCWRCKCRVPEATTVCAAGVGTQCKDSKACRERWEGGEPRTKEPLAEAYAEADQIRRELGLSPQRPNEAPVQGPPKEVWVTYYNDGSFNHGHELKHWAEEAAENMNEPGYLKEGVTVHVAGPYVLAHPCTDSARKADVVEMREALDAISHPRPEPPLVQTDCITALLHDCSNCGVKAAVPMLCEKCRPILRSETPKVELARIAVEAAAWDLHLHMYPSPDGTEATCPAPIYKSLCDALKKLNAAQTGSTER